MGQAKMLACARSQRKQKCFKQNTNQTMLALSGSIAVSLLSSTTKRAAGDVFVSIQYLTVFAF